MKATARLAGLLYLIVAVLGIYGFFYVHGQLYATGNTAATAAKMVAREPLLRSSILIHVISNILFLTVAVLLYELLKTVHALIARLMLCWVAIAIPLFFITEALEITSFFIFKAELLSSFAVSQSQDIAAVLIRISNVTGQLLMFHWGLWLMPLGWLVYQSNFIPRLFGVLLWINGAGYMIASVTYILWPATLPLITSIVMPTYFAGELPFIFWLLIKGVRSTVIPSTEHRD
jgi:Domain of unknown function (DUF4386)